MSRRRRVDTQASEHGPRPGGSVEIMDDGGAEAGADEVLRTGGGFTRPLGLALAAAAVAVIAVLTFNSRADQDPVSPSSTDSEDGGSVAESAAGSAPERPSDVLTGRGPNLDWEQIIWNIRTDEFRWIDDAFVGEDGVTEWSILPTVIDTAIQQRQSLQLAYPDHYPIDAEGARVLAPRVDQPDHLLFFRSEGGSLEPTRVDLPTRPLVSDLVVRRSEIQAAVVADDAVVVVQRSDRIDPATLGPRIGIDLIGTEPEISISDDQLTLRISGVGANSTDDVVNVPLVELGLTVTELEALRPREPQIEVLAVDLASGTTGPPGIVPDGLAQLGVAGNRFVLSWDNGDVAGHVSTSSDGRSWRPSASRVGITDVRGDATSIVGIEQATGDIARSGNGATSWQYTPEPFPKYEATVAVDHVAVRELAMGQDGLDPSAQYQIDLVDYDLVLTDGGRSFRLADADSGDVVSSGRIGDPATGAAYDPFDRALTVIDPANGEAIRVDRSRLEFAFTTTGRTTDRVPMVGFARWDGGQPPQWRLEPVDAVFGPSALAVDFVSGGGHLLAIVTTENGYTFHIAEIT